MSTRLGPSFSHSRRRHWASAGSFLAALFLAAAAFGDHATQALVDTRAVGCQGVEDHRYADDTGASPNANAGAKASELDCTGQTVYSFASASADLATGAMRVNLVTSRLGSDAMAQAGVADVVILKPVPGEVASIVLEFAGKLSGEDSTATYSFDVGLPDGRFSKLDTIHGPSKLGVGYRRSFVVPPQGYSMPASVTLGATASNGSSVDLHQSAHVRLDGVEIVSSDSGVFLRDARPDIPGDANRDGVVNAQDILIVRQNYGTSPAVFGSGDFNGDDRVGPDDLLILRRALANTRPGAIALPASDAAWLAAGGADAGAPTSAVPEPATVGLLFLPVALGRRRRSSTLH